MRVLFVVRSLELGGAERQLALLARCLRQRGDAVTVAVLYRTGPFVQELERADVRIRSLGKSRRWDVVGPMLQLVAIVRELRPEVIHGYLTVSNLLAFVARLARPNARLLWGVRDAKLNLAQYDWRERTAFRLARLCAPFVDVIIANSSAGAGHYRSAGFRPHRLVVIPNGIDVSRFTFSGTGRSRVRREWSVRGDAWLVGIVGRLDPSKDHELFLRAAALLLREVPNARFVCVGGGPVARAESLKALARELEIDQHIVWAGPRDDMPDVYSAVDLCVSSSRSEGFPNVIGEAMACGTPCVVTDVGDSARLVGRFGEVIRPRDPRALSQGCLRIRDRWEDGSLGRDQLRSWIASEFGVDRMVDRSLAVMRAPETSTSDPRLLGMEAR